MLNNKNNYNLFKFEDREFSLDVNVSPNEKTVWLTQKQMSLLYNTSVDNIGLHIRNIFRQNELPFSVAEESSVTENDGKKYKTKIYNLDMVLAVGYRVNSKRGILFRKWATSILKQYMLNGFSVNEKRCLECQGNLVNLNNKVEYLLNENHSTLQRLDSLEHLDTLSSDKLFFEGQIFDAYSYIKQLFTSAKSSISIIDGYVDLSVLDMLVDITLPITIYTYPSSILTKQDIDKFNIHHNLNVIQTNKIHDRFIIIDDTIYLCGASIKDVGKKRFVLIKIDFINATDLTKYIN